MSCDDIHIFCLQMPYLGVVHPSCNCILICICNLESPSGYLRCMGMDCVQDKCIRGKKTVGADFKGQNKVEVNKYGLQPIINAFSKYRCPSVSFRCAI